MFCISYLCVLKNGIKSTTDTMYKCNAWNHILVCRFDVAKIMSIVCTTNDDADTQYFVCISRECPQNTKNSFNGILLLPIYQRRPYNSFWLCAETHLREKFPIDFACASDRWWSHSDLRDGTDIRLKLIIKNENTCEIWYNTSSSRVNNADNKITSIFRCQNSVVTPVRTYTIYVCYTRLYLCVLVQNARTTAYMMLLLLL